MFIDGNYVGLTPLILSIAKGTHTLKLEKTGYATLQEELSVQSDISLYKNMQINTQQNVIETQRPEQVYKLENNNFMALTIMIIIMLIIVPIIGYTYFRSKK